MEIERHRHEVGKELKGHERRELSMEPLQQISWLNSILWLQWSRIEKPDQWNQFFTIYGPLSPLVVACLTLQILFLFEARALPIVCIKIISYHPQTDTMSSQVRFVRSLKLVKSVICHNVTTETVNNST